MIDQDYAGFIKMVDSMGPNAATSLLRKMSFDKTVLERIIARYEDEKGVVKEHGTSRYVGAGGHMSWYTGPQPNDIAWHALRSRLDAKGWMAENIESLDRSTSRIVERLEHPSVVEFTTKGLVIGYVQSGKTTNFTGVMAKAADRGYRMFIVLSGIHNELRRQTQRRLATDLVVPDASRWHELTDPDHDFSPLPNTAAYLAGHSEQRLLCVIKKNGPRLRALIEWLSDPQAQSHLRQIPTLIIDDEADQAAIATKTINPLIRQLIAKFPKVAYVGYTATPFANVLVDPADPDDLYPRDFIIALPKPTGHVGTEVIFGREPNENEDPEEAPTGEDMVRVVDQDETGWVQPDGSDDFLPLIEGELAAAVRWFWLATAARRARGDYGHSTMLLHTSIKVAAHEAFKEPLRTYRERILSRLDDQSVYATFREQWEYEACAVTAESAREVPVTFDDVWAGLRGVIAACSVVIDNSKSADRLDYDNGAVVAIAVGGNTLSRGLTLEGLVVSYFVRGATAYDTLLQMGRWFGYRIGYSDLPRIWMTDELRRWFRHIASVEEDLRRDIDRYMTEDETPLTFAARIRTHPALRVTAAAKMRNATVVASSYGGQRLQTRYFRPDDREWLAANQRAARRLVSAAAGISSIETPNPSIPERVVLRNVPVGHILRFLDEYGFHEQSQDCDAELIGRYINKRIQAGSLRLWNVAVLGNSKQATGRYFDFGGGVVVPTIVRSRLDESPGHADIKTLMSRPDLSVDLATVDSSATEKDIKRARDLELPTTGFLALYPIDQISTPTRQERHALNASMDVIGVGMAFPNPPEGLDATSEKKFVSTSLAGVIEDEDQGLFI